MSTTAPEYNDDDLIDTYGEDDTDPLGSLDQTGRDTKSVYESSYRTATERLDTKRNRYLSDFGLNTDKEPDQDAQFGTYQDTLRRGGAHLSSFEGRSAGRGFLGGSGLARSGAEQARAGVADEKDMLLGRFEDTIAGDTYQLAALGDQFDLNLIQNKQASFDRKWAAQSFIDPVEELPEIDGEDPAPADPAEAAPDTAVREPDNVEKAGRFAKRRLKRMRKAGIFKGSIPLKDVEAAAKFRQFNAKLTPAQRKLLKKKVK